MQIGQVDFADWQQSGQYKGEKFSGTERAAKMENFGLWTKMENLDNLQMEKMDFTGIRCCAKTTSI